MSKVPALFGVFWLLASCQGNEKSAAKGVEDSQPRQSRFEFLVLDPNGAQFKTAGGSRVCIVAQNEKIVFSETLPTSDSEANAGYSKVKISEDLKCVPEKSKGGLGKAGDVGLVYKLTDTQKFKRVDKGASVSEQQETAWTHPVQGQGQTQQGNNIKSDFATLSSGVLQCDGIELDFDWAAEGRLLGRTPDGEWGGFANCWRVWEDAAEIQFDSSVSGVCKGMDRIPSQRTPGNNLRAALPDGCSRMSTIKIYPTRLETGVTFFPTTKHCRINPNANIKVCGR